MRTTLLHRRAVLSGLLAAAVPALAAPPLWTGRLAGVDARLTLTGPRGGLATQEVVDWVKDGIRQVAAWYGRFPVRQLDVVLRWGPGRGLRGGVTYGGPAPRIEGAVGRDSTTTDLYGGWVWVHELVHLACPQVPGRHHWLEEGLATYVEPWVRVKAGQLPVERAWSDLVRGLPQGQPRAGDRGLDHTPTWGRTYWGGALYCLVADVQIREATGNQRGLADALRGIVAGGGSMHVAWPLARVLALGDDATGTDVLTRVWHAHRAEPVPVDLDALWSKLGVVRAGGSVRFDDSAPGAAVRRRIPG